MILRAWWSRVIGSLRRGHALDREMDAEMEFHVEMATRRNVERGMPPETARREARLMFGSADAFREEGREAQRARVAENVLSDLRTGLRGLRRSPSFAAAAILIMGLGIGASAAMFTVVNAVLLRPLPIPNPGDFTYLGWMWRPGDEVSALTDFKYEFVRDHNRGFDAVATFRTQEAHLGDESAAQPVRGLRVKGDFFGTIGFNPRLGRAFDERELAAGGPPVVILGHDVWSTRFGGDPGILGRQIRLDGEPRSVVGVLPPEFRFPPATENTGYIVPLVVRADPDDEGHNTEVIGRLRHDMTAAAIASEVAALSSAYRGAYPTSADSGSFRLYSHTDVHVGGAARHTLWVLLGAVSLVLLIACANTATLLLVRASARQHEIAVRASIGAGRGRILQQLITEGLVLSSLAAVAGSMVSVVAVRGFLATAPIALPADAEMTIDMRVLAFALAVSIGTGLVFGLAAAVPAFRTQLQSVLLGGARGATRGSTRFRETLVLVETAAAVVLLSAATVLAASFVRLISVDPGFDADGVVAVRIGRLPPGYDAPRREELVERLLERVAALPGVERAAAAPNLPLERGLNFPMDTPEGPELAIGAVELRFVSPGYSATLGVPLLAGRDFNAGDAADTEPVAIVNEAFARHFWSDAQDVVGRPVRIGHFRDRWIVPPEVQRHTRVIGVVSDIREIGLDREPRPTVLVPRAQSAQGTPLLLVRGATPTLSRTLHDVIIAEEPQLAPRIESLDAVVSRSVAEPRFRTALVAAFAGFALLLAGIGIYGVIAAVVQQRQREIGIRIALGANRAAVAAAVVRRCLMNVAAGALIGLLVFWAMRRVLAAWLYDIAPGDARALAVTVAVLVLVAAVASWIPARRATRINPAVSLRFDS